MSKRINSAAGDLSEGRVPSQDKIQGEDNAAKLNPVEIGLSSAPAGIFSLRRASYFNAAMLDKTGHGVRRADIAEAAIAAAEAAIAHHKP